MTEASPGASRTAAYVAFYRALETGTEFDDTAHCFWVVGGWRATGMAVP